MIIQGNDILRAFAVDAECGFRMLTRQAMRPLYWHIRRLVVSHHDAEDVLQETLLRAYRSLPSLRDGSTLGPWLYRIATNEALRHIEQRNRMVLASGDDAGEEAARVMSEVYVDYSDLEAVKLRDAVLSLPPKQQATFNLRYFDELEYSEIAEILQCSEPTAKANYHFAKEKIKKYISSCQ